MTRTEQQLFTGLPEASAVWRIVPDDRAGSAFAHFTTAEAATAVARSALQAAEPPASAFTLVRGALAKARVLAALQIQGRVELLALPGSATGEEVVGPVT